MKMSYNGILNNFRVGSSYLTERKKEVVLLGYNKTSMKRTKNLLNDYVEGLICNTLYVDTEEEILEFIEKSYAYSLIFAQNFNKELSYTDTFRLNTSYHYLQEYVDLGKEKEDIALWFVKNQLLGVRMIEYFDDKYFDKEVEEVKDFVLSTINKRDKEEWLKRIYDLFFYEVSVIDVEGLFKGIYYEPSTRTFYRYTNSANKKFYQLNTCKGDSYRDIFLGLKHLDNIQEKKFKYWEDFDKLYLVNRR